MKEIDPNKPINRTTRMYEASPVRLWQRSSASSAAQA